MATLVRICCLAAMLAWPAVAVAQEFPSRTVRFVVPFPAGGPSDTMSRILVERMAVALGATIVIENRSGAGGITGIAAVARAEPDGYTVGLAASSALAMDVSLRSHMPFHPLTDLALITQVTAVPEVLVVDAALPVTTLDDLVAMARARPGTLAFGSTGVGGMPHLAMELLKLTAHIDLVHAPYTGAAPAVNDLLGGHVQVMFADVPVLLGNLQAGRLRALAVGSRTRIAALPAVPTMAELGMPQVEADNWYGLVAPAATPPAVLARLHAAAVAALQDDAVKDRLAAQGAVAVGNSSPAFSAYVASEIARWGAVIAATGLRVD